MKIWLPDDGSCRQPAAAAKRLGVEVRLLPSIKELRTMYAEALRGLQPIPIIADASMPPNSFELRSGDQRVRVRWPDPETELSRWADDGGAP